MAVGGGDYDVDVDVDVAFRADTVTRVYAFIKDVFICIDDDGLLQCKMGAGGQRRSWRMVAVDDLCKCRSLPSKTRLHNGSFCSM